jgi:hypothetical protein
MLSVICKTLCCGDFFNGTGARPSLSKKKSLLGREHGSDQFASVTRGAAVLQMYRKKGKPPNPSHEQGSLTDYHQ